MHTRSPLIVWFEDVGPTDVALVGGKNASLGEMVRNLGKKSIKVPPGFATTAGAYWNYVEANGLRRVCGQAPSDHPEFADFLVDCDIDSISVSPDSFIVVKQHVAAREAAASETRNSARRVG